MTVGISARARLDLLEIEAYISLDNPWRAGSFIEELIQRIEQVGERPLSFPVWRSEFPHIRVARYKKYLILFSHKDGKPRVERVLHGARDIDTLLSDRA